MARADELRRIRAGGPVRVPWWCLAGTALAHFALLASGAQALSDWKQGQLQPKPSDTPLALKVRYVPVPVVPPMALAAEEQPPVAATFGPTTLPSPLPEPSPPPELSEQPVAPVVEPAIYVPRALLSVGPVARTPVLLQWPPSWPLRRTYTAILKLYLDEQGRVERVEPDDEAVLPAPLFETAREAFMAAEFSPGQLNGQAVKSWMRIEVNFESEKVTAPP